MGGSGILIVCKFDGSWFLFSGIKVGGVGGGFVIGVEIYDCVVVINIKEVFDFFIKICMSFGFDFVVIVGFFGVGGFFDWGVLVN